MERYKPSTPPPKRSVGRPRGSFRHVATMAMKQSLAHIAQAKGPACMEKLWAIIASNAKDITPGVRITAIGMWLDRGYGRPNQSHEVHTQTIGLQLTPEMLMKMDGEDLARLDALLTKLSGRSSADGQGGTPVEGEGNGSAYANTLH